MQLHRKDRPLQVGLLQGGCEHRCMSNKPIPQPPWLRHNNLTLLDTFWLIKSLVPSTMQGADFSDKFSIAFLFSDPDIGVQLNDVGLIQSSMLLVWIRNILVRRHYCRTQQGRSVTSHTTLRQAHIKPRSIFYNGMAIFHPFLFANFLIGYTNL